MNQAVNHVLYSAIRAIQEGRATVDAMPGYDARSGQPTRCVIVRKGGAFLTIHRTASGKNRVRIDALGQKLEAELDRTPAIFERYLTVGGAA